MIKKSVLLRGAVFGMLLTSVLSGCIKPEAPNAEADIISVEVEGLQLLRAPQITNTTITFPVDIGWVDMSAVTPTFTLTEGATISPASGVPQDFTNPVKYTVTSEDGKWKKEYIVSVVPDKGVPEVFSFEYAKIQEEGHHHVFMSGEGDDATQEWESSNLGFAITAGDKPAESYPVHQFNDGYKGKCVRLTTLSTGPLGAMFGMPLATGSLFMGKLDTKNLIVEPLKGTRFGIPTDKKPLALTGYYKYKAGEKFTNKSGKEQNDKRDIFDLYAVFYEVTEDLQMLDGTNVKTHPNIISLGEISNAKETNEWTRFEIEMKPRPGKMIYPEKLAKKGYNFAIVLSSSKDGATFEGAAGSELLVDEIKVFYE